MRLLLGSSLLLFLMSTVQGPDAVLQKDIDLVIRQGRGTPEGRAAWDRVSQVKAVWLPEILEGMNTPDTVAANWLRTAFDQIVERERKAGGKDFDLARLLAFVKNSSKQGRPRRLALDLVESLKPGTRDLLYQDSLDDPEFRYEAVAQVLEKARNTAKAGNSLIAVKLFRQAFEKSRDVQQARDAAAGLQSADVSVSVGAHLGCLMDWYLIGPLDGKGQKGFHLSYPPEKKVDLNAELDGKDKKVRWIRHQLKEPGATSTNRPGLVDLRAKTALGNAEDAVAFAYTEFTVDKAMEAEMRGAADDNFTVWVNGVKVFGVEEWQNGVRFDRHRFPVRLVEGKNSVLVKICENATPGPERTWEFFLRVVDATGKGIPMRNLLK